MGGLSVADSLMQIAGKINRDMDYEYSGATAPPTAAALALSPRSELELLAARI